MLAAWHVTLSRYKIVVAVSYNLREFMVALFYIATCQVCMFLFIHISVC
jgi:hypothetical protein